jgi:putative sigma-54 modulation protein
MAPFFFALITIFVQIGLLTAFSPTLRTSKWRPTVTSIQGSSVDILAREIDLTEPLKERIDTKLGGVLSKFEGLPINSCDVVLRVHKHQQAETHTQTTKVNSQIAEVTISLKGGNVIHLTERSDDMYSSVDLVAHKVAQKLGRLKDRVKSKRKTQSAAGASIEDSVPDDINLDVIDFSEYDDSSALPESMMLESMMKPKEFAMPPITVEQAVENLNYIDHPFYVFRNEATNEVNVIYKRDNGGVGLISPEKQDVGK